VLWRGRNPANVGSGQRVGEQARAQQHEPSCGQGQETVGNKVTIGHGDPRRSPWLPELIKTFGKVGMAWLQDEFLLRPGQVRDRTTSNACARKIPAPIKPISAVIASIIANVLCAPGKHKTRAALHSQKHFRRPNPNRSRSRLPRNSCVKAGRLATRVPGLQPLIHHLSCSPFPPRSGCVIVGGT
jgi:hypothetical protein